MYKYFELKEINGEVVVLANKEEKPECDYSAEENAYKHDHARWLKKHETFKPFDKKQEKLFLDWAWDNIDIIRGSLKNQLQQGIEITCCEIREALAGTGYDSGFGTYIKTKKFAFYKPSEPEAKEESQDQMFEEIYNIIGKGPMEGDHETIKSMFTITRNTK